MTVLNIKNIMRKESPIYYRRFYTGVISLEINKIVNDYKAEFIIEHKPTGGKSITIIQIDPINYPVIPLNRELKSFIENLDKNGELPD